jgi:hypothetical protein
MTERDACAILGVTTAATAHEIRSAYRDRVKCHHPDRARGVWERASRTRRLQEVNAAYRALKERRPRPSPGDGAGPDRRPAWRAPAAGAVRPETPGRRALPRWVPWLAVIAWGSAAAFAFVSLHGPALPTELTVGYLVGLLALLVVSSVGGVLAPLVGVLVARGGRRDATAPPR